MSAVVDNMKLALQHELRARELIGRSMVMPTSLAIDRNSSADLLIYSGAGASIAMRTRTYNSAGRMPDWEFTIRYRSSGGGVTEFEKLRSGACSHMFYGVLNEAGDDYCRWMLINLSVWNGVITEYERARARGERRWPLYEIKHNRGDRTSFMVFDAKSKIFRHPMFMVDCWDHAGFGGAVAAARTMRAANNDNARRILYGEAA